MKECPECGKCYDNGIEECACGEKELERTLGGSLLVDGKYRLERCLGKGGMGSVYRAVHTGLQKTFAVKLLRHAGFITPEHEARFKIEAKALGKLDHPNIVQVTDFGVDSRNGRVPYLVMEYLEGVTLYDRLQEQGVLPSSEALPLIESIAHAVDYAHKHGILHRDLKLQNVFLTQKGSNRVEVKILDFGLARLLGEDTGEKQKAPQPSFPKDMVDRDKKAEETQTIQPFRSEDGSKIEPGSLARDRLTTIGAVMGTPGYIPPEIFDGKEATPASDIYAFGVMIHELLAGLKPESTPLLPSSLQPLVPEEIDAVILDGIEKDPFKRPACASLLAERLRNAYSWVEYRAWKAKDVPRRIPIAVGISLVFLFLFGLIQNLTPLKNLENALVDIRFRLMPFKSPDGRILLVSFDEAAITQSSDPLRNTEEISSMLQKVFAAGASGIVIDFWLGERWSRSESFSRLVLENRKKLVLSCYINRNGTIGGLEAVQGLISAALSSDGEILDLFGFINLDPDGDGRLRRARSVAWTSEDELLVSLPVRGYQVLTGQKTLPLRAHESFWIDFSTNPEMFHRVSWLDLPSRIEEQPDFFQGKLVFVGGEYEGAQDMHSVPVRFEEATGLVVNALILNTILSGVPIREIGQTYLLLLAAVMLLGFVSALLIMPGIRIILLALLFFLIFYTAVCTAVFVMLRLIIPVAAPLIILFAATGTVSMIRHRLTFVKKTERDARG